MDVSKQIFMISRMLGVGKERIYIDPKKLSEVSKALTKEDLRNLINQGVIKILDKKGQSRYWANLLKEKRKKGRRRGYGSRKGKKSARFSEKELWIIKIRAIRKFLRKLKEKNLINRKLYRKLYLLAKGGVFRSKRHLKLWLKEQYNIQIPEDIK